MAHSKEIPIYKAKIMNAIKNDYELIRLLDEKYVDVSTKTVLDTDWLIHKKIFPHFYNPETVTEAMSFIMISVDSPRVKDKLIKDMKIIILVVSNQDIMKVPYGIGTRTDQMSVCVDRLLNGRDDLGFGYLDLYSNVEKSLDNKHRCRELIFKVEDFNDIGGRGFE